MLGGLTCHKVENNNNNNNKQRDSLPSMQYHIEEEPPYFETFIWTVNENTIDRYRSWWVYFSIGDDSVVREETQLQQQQQQLNKVEYSTNFLAYQIYHIFCRHFLINVGLCERKVYLSMYFFPFFFFFLHETCDML